MDTHNAFRPSTHPEHWGMHPSPVAECRDETPEYRRRNRKYSVDAIVVTAICGVAIVAVSVLAGWLWPL